MEGGEITGGGGGCLVLGLAILFVAATVLLTMFA
jgi:hypothetical protein